MDEMIKTMLKKFVSPELAVILEGVGENRRIDGTVPKGDAKAKWEKYEEVRGRKLRAQVWEFDNGTQAWFHASKGLD